MHHSSQDISPHLSVPPCLRGEKLFDAVRLLRYHYREMTGYQAQHNPRNVERRRTAR